MGGRGIARSGFLERKVGGELLPNPPKKFSGIPEILGKGACVFFGVFLSPSVCQPF